MRNKSSNLYSNKQRWKIALLVLALCIIGGSLWVSNAMVRKIAVKETAKARQWAQAIQKKAELVRFSRQTFLSLQQKERERIEIVVSAQKTLLNPSNLGVNQDIDFAMNIIDGNKDIPVILLDDRGEISQTKNVVLEPLKAGEKQKDSLLKGMAQRWIKEGRFFTIEVFEGFEMTYAFDESGQLKSLKKQSDSLINTFNQDLISDTRLMPVILVDSLQKKVLSTNLMGSNREVLGKLTEFSALNDPIRINLGSTSQWLFYDQSPEVKQLSWFPYLQLALIALIVLMGYLVFSTFRRAEQNQVWAGMAKETAHQLGTPISSLSAWLALLEAQNSDPESLAEMRKDISRLENVTERFSKIGSETKLENTDVVETVHHTIEYLKPRLSQKVEIILDTSESPSMLVPHNPALMEWVIENITKNAVDAMEGSGKIKVHFSQSKKWVHIDLEDTGKGLLPKQFKAIFQPGYSTKKRGWGLGLSLVKRIVESYHKGKVYVLRSELGLGTTFRISLPL
jgi:signal transduction histidine kinase